MAATMQFNSTMVPTSLTPPRQQPVSSQAAAATAFQYQQILSQPQMPVNVLPNHPIRQFVSFKNIRDLNLPGGQWEHCDHITIALPPDAMERKVRKHDRPGHDLIHCLSNMGVYRQRHVQKYEDKINQREPDPCNWSWVLEALGEVKNKKSSVPHTFWAIFQRRPRARVGLLQQQIQTLGVPVVQAPVQQMALPAPKGYLYEDENQLRIAQHEHQYSSSPLQQQSYSTSPPRQQRYSASPPRLMRHSSSPTQQLYPPSPPRESPARQQKYLDSPPRLVRHSSSPTQQLYPPSPPRESPARQQKYLDSPPRLVRHSSSPTQQLYPPSPTHQQPPRPSTSHEHRQHSHHQAAPKPQQYTRPIPQPYTYNLPSPPHSYDSDSLSDSDSSDSTQDYNYNYRRPAPLGPMSSSPPTRRKVQDTYDVEVHFEAPHSESESEGEERGVRFGSNREWRGRKGMVSYV